MEIKSKPKCMHFRCDQEVEWDMSSYDVTSIFDGVLRYKGECPNCKTNYLHDAESLDALLEELEK